MKHLSKIALFAVMSTVLATGTAVYADDEPSPPAAPPTESYLVSFKAGTSWDSQAASLVLDGVTETDSIPQLRMHAVDLVTGSDALAQLQADPTVARVEPDRTRGADAVPEPRVVGGYGETPGFSYRPHLENLIAHGAPPTSLLRRLVLD